MRPRPGLRFRYAGALILAAACATRGGVPEAASSDACPILADAALLRGTTEPPLPLALPVVAYPPPLEGRKRGGDSAWVQLVVDRDGAAPACGVRVQAISDSALLPHVVTAASELRFQPARFRGVATPAWLTLTLRFATPEQIAALAESPRPPLEIRVMEGPWLRPGGPVPAYPAELIPQRVEGRVVIQAQVTLEGRINLRSVRVIRSDHHLFTEAVRAILPRLRFDPARMGPGGPAAVSQVELPFEFRVPPT